MHSVINPLNAELNPICHMLALLGADHIFHVSRLRVKVRCLLIKMYVCRRSLSALFIFAFFWHK